MSHTLPHTHQRDDVPTVATSDLFRPMRQLILSGRGLALYHGMSAVDLQALDSEIWQLFDDAPHKRLAVALRFRALLHVFQSRRLKEHVLQTGFKGIAAAIAEAAQQRLNTRYGFNAQKFVCALDATRVGAPMTTDLHTDLQSDIATLAMAA
jgi:hypothetical protein